ncbi:MAG: cation:proton antiporter [Anaerolineae bacterium]|nr:cation:proton antiporter [Anaerolineales bacterium]MCQ3976188.1 cation:proton antiporter [Anaerolineae bacterium]
MPEISFSGLMMVAAVAFAVPLLLGLAPRLRLPSVVLEIVAGIVLGPSGLGWVKVDLPIQILALIGLAFLLFLAGLEIEFDRLKGRLLKLSGLSFLVSFGLALLLGFGLMVVGLIEAPLFIAIVLSATALSVLIPALKDTGLIASDFGQLAIAAASIADFATIILLSLFFSREASGLGAQVVLLGGFALLVVLVGMVLWETERWRWLSAVLIRLQDTTAQIRIRGAFLLLAVLVVIAESFGLEAILGAFIAGALLALLDRDEMMTHPQFRHGLEAVGFGVFIPFFFVSSGLRFNLAALFANGSTLILVPVFLAALLLVRGLPALLYRSLLDGPRLAAAGLLQATSLSFIVVATQIGIELELIDQATSAALVAAGLLSVIIFPLVALTILRRSEPAPGAVELGMMTPDAR